MSRTPKIMLCGPSRAAVSGVATHLNQLFGSSIEEKYFLCQYQVGSEGRSEGRFHKLIRYVTSPFSFLAAIVRMRPDIVHLNTSLEPKSFWRDLIYLYTSKLLCRKVVYQVHGGQTPSRFLGSGAFGHAFLRFSLGLPDVVVLLATIELRQYQEFKVATQMEVVPNAIRLEEYSASGPKLFRAENVVLGYIGRLADDKGIKEVILALADLHSRGSRNLSLRIAGSGPYEARLRELVTTLSLEEFVVFLGPVFAEEKLQYWRDIDIFVFPTFHREGLPYTILEALASGTPTVTTRVGGIPDVIRDGVEGILLDAHDPVTVRAALEDLLPNRDVLRKMSESAIRRAAAHYGVQRLAKQFEKLYSGLLT